MLSAEARQCFQVEPAQFITEAIKTFARSSPANRLPDTGAPIFEEPLVRFASGDDPLFTEYKTIIAPDHLAPREALAKAYQKNPEDLPAKLSVISWILPIAAKTRQSNRRRRKRKRVGRRAEPVAPLRTENPWRRTSSSDRSESRRRSAR